MCRFAMGENRTLSGYLSDRINRSGVDEHDRDVILDGVHTAAFAAFETLAIRTQSHRLLADRADEDVEEILGDHDRFILQRREF